MKQKSEFLKPFNNINIILRHFENILYFEIYKCLVLGLVRFGLQSSELVTTLIKISF